MPKLLRRIGQNTGILLLVNGVGSIFGFFMAAALGRGLGDAGFGQYSFVMTWLLSLMLFSEFGLSTVLTRDLAAQLDHTPDYLINSLAGKILLGLPAILLLLFLAPWISPTQNQDVITALRWGVLFLYSGLVFSSFTAVFKAHQRMLPILWLTLSGQMVLFAGTLALILARQPLFTIIAWAGLSQSLQCVLAYGLYKKNISTSGANKAIRFAVIKFLLVRAWPFALAGFLAALQLRANILLLAYLQGDQALGWYAAANRFVEMGKQLPGAYYVAILPAMAALAGAASPDQLQTLQKMFTQSRLGLLGFGLLAAIGALLLARPVLTLTYGSTYQTATSTLQILTLSLIPAAQNSISIIYLYANGDEKFVNLLTLVGIVLNLSLCFWLIPAWGPAGTAMALLMAEVGLYWPYRARVANRQTQETLITQLQFQP